MYYATQGENYLVPVNALVPADESLARHTVEKLLAGPLDKELLKSPLPEGAIVRDLYIKNGIACLDLGGVAGKIDTAAAAQRAVESMVLTLTELPDVEAVQILLDGHEVDRLGSTVLKPPLKRPTHINPLPGGNPDGPEVRLYFSYRDAYLVPVTVHVEPESKDLIRATLEQLIAGPQGIPELSPVFPAGTRVLRLTREGDLLELDFSPEAVLRDTKGNIRSEQSITLGALAYTLRQFSGLKRLEVRVGGELLKVPGLKQPIPIPASYREWFGPDTARGMFRLLPVSG
ncbi:MAG TPA: GerMN domain-containing protein [Firmicutes bacterium]|nr:GerMN domain-containing protein [Bacillota bacterium]